MQRQNNQVQSQNQSYQSEQPTCTLGWTGLFLFPKLYLQTACMVTGRMAHCGWFLNCIFFIVMRCCFFLQQQGINPVSSTAKGKVVSDNVDFSSDSDEVFVLHHWQPVNLQLSGFCLQLLQLLGQQ